VVIFPTYYAGTHRDNARLIGPGKALDPEAGSSWCRTFRQWRVVVAQQTTTPSAQRIFSAVTILDNARCICDSSPNAGIERVALAMGWSVERKQGIPGRAVSGIGSRRF